MSFVSVFELFKLGVGPSSSHTVGPMRAGHIFVDELGERLGSVARVRATLFGSLAHTGRGHATDRAVICGLSGIDPERYDPEAAAKVWREARAGSLWLGGRQIAFDLEQDLVFDGVREVGGHPNELRFEALDAAGSTLADETFFSVGGGFLSRPAALGAPANPSAAIKIPHPFSSGAELLRLCTRLGHPIWEIVRLNERAARTEAEIDAGLERIAEAMLACIDRGLGAEGILPGGLAVRRRAAALARRLSNAPEHSHPFDWVQAWAMAVNEENAAGARVVTAPTNGAAGVVPAVLRYYLTLHPTADLGETWRRYFLTATAVGGLFKLNASISGAEVGCQGEVGTAASMAAAGLCALMGGSSAQIENAAEIAIEHHLGLTCDPVGGLVQVPCIERNGFGAHKAIGAARLALLEDGEHRVSLDQAIATLRRTGEDMSSKYKETSLGVLAVSVVEC